MRISLRVTLIVLSLTALAAGKAPAPSKPHVLPFIEDDYPKALAEARAKKIPLFIDASAPWCHTCRSMQAFVFTDAALKDEANRFVWLEIDTEKATNAAWRKQYPMRAYPTYFVVEPDHEQVLLRWVGGTTVPQLKTLLADSRTTFERVRGGRLAASGSPAPSGSATGKSPDDLLAQADLLYGEGKAVEAAAAYQSAIQAAPADWHNYGRAVEALLTDWAQEENCVPAIQAAHDAYPRLAKTTSVATVASVGLDCSVALPDSVASKKESVAFFEKVARDAVADLSIPMAADDRSGVYISLLEARKVAGDPAGAHAVAASWSSFLDHAAATASTPEARAVFDPHRLLAYMELGEPDKAVPMLRQTEQDFPKDYNPSFRLAVAYKAMQRYDDALASCDRAVSLGYGPRLLNILRTRADIQVAKGDTAAARATLTDAVQKAEALPDGQRSASTLTALQQKLDSLSPAKPAETTPN